MRRLDLPVRAAGLILTGEFVVHELRYLIAPVSEAEHGYLPLLAVLSIVALVAAAGRLAGSLEVARSTGRDSPTGLDFRSAWKLLALSIALVFSAQELIEGIAGGGGAHAPLTIFESGGWVAYPLALGISAVLALALTGARAVVSAVARAARTALRRRRSPRRRLPTFQPRPAGRPLAVNLAGRAPPRLF